MDFRREREKYFVKDRNVRQESEGKRERERESR